MVYGLYQRLSSNVRKLKHSFEIQNLETVRSPRNILPEYVNVQISLPVRESEGNSSYSKISFFSWWNQIKDGFADKTYWREAH